MSEIRLSSEKRLRLFTGRAFPELAQEVGDELGIPLTPTSAYDFANGEIFVRFEESVRGCDAFVLQSHATPVNKHIMEQLIMVDALKRASAVLKRSAIRRAEIGSRPRCFLSCRAYP